VPDVVAQAERTNLLEAIQELATEPKMHIRLFGFWRRRGWTRRQRFCLLAPLIGQRILHIAYSADQPLRFLQAMWYEMLAQPANTVILNSRDWTRMATDRSGKEPSIIVGRITGGMNQIGGSHNTMTQQESAAEHISPVIQALRDDAKTSPGVRADALGAADGIEEELDGGRLSAVANRLKFLRTLVDSNVGLMENTRRVLDALGL